MRVARLRADISKTFKGLSIIDRLLPLIILVCMISGVLLSVYVPKSRVALDAKKIVHVSIPIAIGLILMIFPPLCAIEWETFSRRIRMPEYIKALAISFVLNWIVCPLLMLGLSWLTLWDKPEFGTGIIMIGLARCIAMVLMWNDVAEGDKDLCALIVLVNGLLQIVLYAPYQILFCKILGPTIPSTRSPSYSDVAQSVAFFMGIPFGAGLLVRLLGVLAVGKRRYNEKILPFIKPWALIGLLYTIVVIFMINGYSLVKHIGDAFRCFVPLIVYFIAVWFGTFFLLRWLSGFRWSWHLASRSDSDETQPLCGCEDKLEQYPEKSRFGCKASYKLTVAQSLTAASNNFELSLAIAISIYGGNSDQAIAATFGPLLEVPILLILCFVARYFRIALLWSDVDAN